MAPTQTHSTIIPSEINHNSTKTWRTALSQQISQHHTKYAISWNTTQRHWQHFWAAEASHQPKHRFEDRKMIMRKRKSRKLRKLWNFQLWTIYKNNNHLFKLNGIFWKCMYMYIRKDYQIKKISKTANEDLEGNRQWFLHQDRKPSFCPGQITGSKVE